MWHFLRVMCEVSTRYAFHVLLIQFRLSLLLFMVFMLVFSEAAGVPAPTDPSGDKMSLDQAIGDLDASVAQE